MNDIEKMKAQWEAQDKFEIEQAYRDLMSTRQGRKFLYYVLELTKFMQQPFNGQALGTAFNCGEQNVGKRILADMLNVAPDSFVVLMKEANDDNRTRTNALAGANAGADPYTLSDSDS